jgi:hypothetical protein
VITNGYDKTITETRALDAKFTMSHIGSLLTGRNPTILWAVLQELVHENEAFRTSFELRLIGVVSRDVLDTIYSYGLEDQVTLVGYLSHSEAVACQTSSQILLLVEIDSEETKGIIPGKLFEYMAAQRPILALGPEGWDAGEIISETQTGAVFTYTEKSELKSLLLSWFHLYKNGQLAVTANTIEKYSRRELTGKLAAYITWE